MINKIHLIIFDFDGVLTDNSVSVDSNGNEFVRCNRSDGLAFEALSKLGMKTIICSTEKNKVVMERGKKLKVETFNAIGNKFKWLKSYISLNKINPENVLFIGNDINDYFSMKFCGFSACPSDSEIKIREIASFVLTKKGGEGIAREIVEDILKIDLLNILYPQND